MHQRRLLQRLASTSNLPAVVLVVVMAAAVFSGAPGAWADLVDGRIVDAAGQPMAGCRVAPVWHWSGLGNARSTGELRVNAEGRFRVNIPSVGPHKTLTPYNHDYTLAGMAILKPGETNEVVITMKPSIHVTAQVTCVQLGGEPGRFNMYWRPIETSRPIVVVSHSGVVNLRLAPHDSWRYRFTGPNIKNRAGEVKMSPDVRRAAGYDMGTVDLKATYVALNVGMKPEEWKVTEARGVAVDEARLQDLTGKWLLVEFWGFW